ncbi:MAG TPA: DMT family transporter [Chitinophagaceae bacterium]|nr:DMT family transporter [Chitinophagaceae bacterium]
MNGSSRWLLAGSLFAILWASAAAATRIGLLSAQPLVIAELRFGMASAFMLLLAHGVYRQRLPAGSEWKQLLIYGLLNISIYLGLYVVAMQTVSAGIGTLAVAANPVLIAFLSVFFLGKKITLRLFVSIIVCIGGVLLAAWPQLQDASVSWTGLLILMAGMLAYSAGAIYVAGKKWNGLSLLSINGWQTFLGGLCLLPVMLFCYDAGANHFDTRLFMAVGWLAFFVSFAAVQLWLWLLRINPVRAGLWLFICPVAGFLIAAVLLHEPLSWHTLVGMLLVLAGLGVVKSEK